MVSLQCAICGKNEKTIVLYPENFTHKKVDAKTFSARRIPDRVHFQFMKCLKCGLIFSSPIMPLDKIKKLYQESDFDYEQESHFLRKTYGFYLKKTLVGEKKKKIRLLDIGCGNGFFLEEAKEMGIDEVYGIEPGKPSVMKAKDWLKKRITIGFFNDKSFKKNSFDIICCFQTLDHIIDPNTFLTNIYETLKPGGKALFIVHNTDGLSVKLFGEKSPIFDIEHMYLFNTSNLKELFTKNSFNVGETFNVKNNYPLKYWTTMAPFPKSTKRFLLSLIKKTRLADVPITISAGNIGIIVQKY